ncbi:MAG TPA: hypothetical protein PKC59_16105, partial [Burkholderiaceae bacterium]|nr:hypothetical protein [Burkholderiaceae bacterium]
MSAPLSAEDPFDAMTAAQPLLSMLNLLPRGGLRILSIAQVVCWVAGAAQAADAPKPAASAAAPRPALTVT